jgi:hypothetical protein
MVWRNGYIPENELVIFKRGRNSTDGDWFWGLTPGTYARHLALVELGRSRHGRTLEPSDGWGTYRPYDGQVIARRIYGNGAAVPGTSSHGGFWEGRETLAIDYSNWAWVYNGDRAAFFADVRAVGLTPDMISTRRGYPDEPWHVIDLNPRTSPSVASDTASPITPKEWDEMATEAEVKRAAKEAALEAVREANRADIPRGTYIWSPGRGGGLVDPTFGFISLAQEEADVALAVYGAGPEMNDRQFDVAAALANRMADMHAQKVADAIQAKQAR